MISWEVDLLGVVFVGVDFVRVGDFCVHDNNNDNAPSIPTTQDHEHNTCVYAYVHECTGIGEMRYVLYIPTA